MLDLPKEGERVEGAATGGGEPKILFLIDTLRGMGGAEGALLKIVTHLPKLGYKCAVGSFDLRRDPDFLRLFPCPVYDLNLRRIYGWNALRVALKLRKLVVKERFDIIHTMFPTSDLWGGPIARFGMPSLLVSSRRDMGIVRSRKHDLAYRWLGGQFDQVQAVADAVGRACIARDSLDPRRVATVHNGVELERIAALEPFADLARTFGLNPDGLTVATAAGKIWPVKGIDILIRSAKIVCREFPRTNFLVAGWLGDDYAKQVQQQAESLGLSGNVKFIGRSPDIVSILKASDVFCVPSRSEGLSNALLEAMACGRPCVATAIGGNPEVVVEGQTGFLAPSEDPERLAARILDLLRDPELRRRMGENGRERVREHFTVEVMVRRMSVLYQELLASRPRGA
jgi:glycosyltransferase involved in cell wall biosynthesis